MKIAYYTYYILYYSILALIHECAYVCAIEAEIKKIHPDNDTVHSHVYEIALQAMKKICSCHYLHVPW